MLTMSNLKISDSKQRALDKAVSVIREENLKAGISEADSEREINQCINAFPQKGSLCLSIDKTFFIKQIYKENEPVFVHLPGNSVQNFVDKLSTFIDLDSARWNETVQNLAKNLIIFTGFRMGNRWTCGETSAYAKLPRMKKDMEDVQSILDNVENYEEMLEKIYQHQVEVLRQIKPVDNRQARPFNISNFKPEDITPEVRRAQRTHEKIQLETMLGRKKMISNAVIPNFLSLKDAKVKSGWNNILCALS